MKKVVGAIAKLTGAQTGRSIDGVGVANLFN